MYRITTIGFQSHESSREGFAEEGESRRVSWDCELIVLPRPRVICVFLDGAGLSAIIRHARIMMIFCFIFRCRAAPLADITQHPLLHTRGTS